jgi:hypothetical protein
MMPVDQLLSFREAMSRAILHAVRRRGVPAAPFSASPSDCRSGPAQSAGRAPLKIGIIGTG